MKKYFLVLCALALIVGLVMASPVLAFTACIGFFFAFGSVKISEMRGAYIGFNLVNAYLYRFADPAANGMQEQPALVRCQKYLFDYLRAKGNAVTVFALDSDALKFEAVTYYVRYSITGLSGKQKFLGQNTQNVVGESNFAVNAVLQQYYNFAFDRIAIAYVADNTSGFANVYNSAAFTSVRASVAAGLGNGELSLYINKNLVLDTPAVDFLGEAAVSGGSIGDYTGGTLQEPIVFPENTQLEGYIDMPVVIPSTANFNYVMEVRFYGVRARMRA